MEDHQGSSFYILRLKATETTEKHNIAFFLSYSLSTDPRWIYMLASMTPQQRVTFLQSTIMEPCLDYLLAQGEVWYASDMDMKVQGVLTFVPPGIPTKIPTGTKIWSGISAVWSLGTGLSLMTDYLAFLEEFMSKYFSLDTYRLFHACVNDQATPEKTDDIWKQLFSRLFRADEARKLCWFYITDPKFIPILKTHAFVQQSLSDYNHVAGRGPQVFAFLRMPNTEEKKNLMRINSANLTESKADI